MLNQRGDDLVGHLFVLPSGSQQSTAATGATVDIQGVVLQMPRGIKDELSAPGDLNDDVYPLAANLSQPITKRWLRPTGRGPTSSGGFSYATVTFRQYRCKDGNRLIESGQGGFMRRAYAPDTEHALDDEELQRRIEERIDSDPAFWTVMGKRRTKSLIAVDVDEGYVTLSGSVRSASERRRADILARALGARRVDNRLQVESEVDARAS